MDSNNMDTRIMNEWITDRVPNENGCIECVWITNQYGVVELADRNLVDKGTPWMEPTEPKPYVPPEPSTSLEDDCEALRTFFASGECECDTSVGHICEVCHYVTIANRVIEAAGLQIKRNKIKSEKSLRDGSTSLYDSLERENARLSYLFGDNPDDFREWLGCKGDETCTCEMCDTLRISEAARKWDDLERRTDETMPKIKAMCMEAIERNDPDGVGIRCTYCGCDMSALEDWDCINYGPMYCSTNCVSKAKKSSIEPQTFAEHVAEINELGLGYHGPKEKQDAATEPKRLREWWIETGSRSPRLPSDALYAWPDTSENRPQDYTHVREVDEAHDQWVERLIELCEKMVEVRSQHEVYWPCVVSIEVHIKQRGEA